MKKLILNGTWICKGSTLAKTILRKNKVGEFTISDFRFYCKATVIMTVWIGKTIDIESHQVQKLTKDDLSCKT